MPKRRSFHTKNILPILLFSLIAIVAVGVVFAQTVMVQRSSREHVLAATRSTVTYVASQVFTEDGSNFGSGSWFGTGQNASKSFAGIRFEGITIPAGATIENVVLQVISSQDQWIAQSTGVYADTSGGAAFSSSSPPSARNLSSQTVTYSDNTKWTKGTTYDLPSLQQLIPALNLSNSQTVALILKGQGGSWGRKFINGTESSATAPKLVVTYMTSDASPTASPTSSTAPTTAPSVTASPKVTVRPTATPGLPPGSGTTSTPGGNSHAMGQWIQSKWDTCPTALHESFSVVGPDGKRYPTWHPPATTNPSTGKECTFGHEHGRDPRGSKLWGFIQEQNAYDANRNGTIESSEVAASGLPFGYVNERLDEYNLAKSITNGMRHEDHVGTKIMWENNVQRDQSGTAGGSNRKPVDLYCDMLISQHQGTHSKDAFTNNVHATQYYIDCNRGSLVSQYPVKLALQFMSVFGKAGGFAEGGFAGGFKFISVGTANPTNSPSSAEPGRSLPTIQRVLDSVLVPNGQFSQFSLGLYEDWVSGSHLTTKEGRELVYVDPHFAVFEPSRFFDPSKPDATGRSIDVCYMKEGNGDRARGGACDEVTNFKDGSTIPVDQRITYDDPRSPFNGCKREFYFNNNGIYNAGGPTYWYTDPYGKNATTTPFPGSIRQYVASVKTTLSFPLESIALGRDINWCGRGVHAPN